MSNSIHPCLWVGEHMHVWKAVADANLVLYISLELKAGVQKRQIQIKKIIFQQASCINNDRSG